MRLDNKLVELGLIESRNKAKYEIESGNVLVNNKVVTKPAYEIKEDDNIEFIKQNELKYVSKGGLKLEKALKEYNINPLNLTCLDIGSSTGGFTDCLIQNGAKLVYAIDTGTNQLHESLRNNPKIISYESTNFLTLDISKLDKIDLIVIDVSFVKVETILDKVIDSYKDAIVISLIKPQFEIGKTYIKNGVIKDPKVHKKVIEQIELYLKSKQIKYSKIIESPILGGSGNKEYLISFKI